MKSVLIQGLAAVLLAGEVAAKNVASLSQGFVAMPIQGHSTDNHPNPRYERLRQFTKRDDTLQVTLDNQFTYYSIDIDVGTPSQNLSCLIDTGSSDLWVLASNNPYCAKNPSRLTPQSTQIDCSQSGTFNYNDSTTFKMNTSSEFFIQYGDFTFAQGKWGTDKLTFGSTTINSVSIGIGMEANSSQNVFGVGLTGLESTNVGSTAQSSSGGYTYSNVPVLLKSQGDIEWVAYSLYLNDIDAKTGNILFGGVDHDKYTGNLVTVPLVNNVQGVSSPIEFTVMLSQISLTDSKGNTATIMQSNIPALLDSGTTLTFLPTQVVTSIAYSIGAQYSSSLGMFVAPCSDGNASGALTYNFNGASVKVPLKQLFMSLTDSNGNPATFDNGQSACALALSPSDDEIILGDSFLRSAYVVYDLENLEISLANTNFDSSSSNIEVIKSSVPSATKASGYSSTAFATAIQVHTDSTAVFSHATGTISATGIETSVITSSTPTSTSTSTSTSTHHGGAGSTTPVAGTLLSLLALVGLAIV
ncbi:aspartic proteinase 3 [Trichomonascus vanleenenianus]|uniref:pepsin-like aspartic protease n=1 Tax=Trichomonascus vanleenenianus TaxID=2268995 RepID=UPI003EC98DC5